ncbi:acyltransferase family protein [Streptomonospora wellingtoniae]|uniref:Acyltransferase family protein n=1 Tax=Streptomonospora wellingtoniae TaxID=3075544 RepID=A0ABU2KNK3_9ACTN|nr:acyltransferase family protein [Streptomonospora sp. DSM 45055]MDT0300728.1 acyltransferase family protein [Streptomonospora sp. DSM 45055]
MSAETRSASTASTTTAPPPVGSERRFLPEVQGLRAVAVGLVLVYHVDHDLLPGGYVGVDVFFVISGFLITSLLLREARTEGRVSLGQFYIRRIRRILPAASVVLAATGLAAFWLLPEPRLAGTAKELAASALYVENLLLADQSVDYLAAESAASPVQHFWSLAVEEQFYLLWPLLFVAWAAGGPLLGRRRAILAVTAGVFAVSLGFSAVLTASDAQPAYFLPQTRMWELAAGGVLAVGAAHITLSAAARWVLGWAGLAAIGYAALNYDDQTPFPGLAALLPVAGAVAVIAAGENGGRWSTYGVLASRPARFGGDISYALYLWHWPVIVFTLVMTGSSNLEPLYAGLVVVVAVLLACATKAAVEDPVRRWGLLRSGKRAASFAVAAAVVVGLIGAGQMARYEWLKSVEFDPVQHVGPAALGTSEPEGSGDAPLYPAPVAASDDLPDVWAQCQANPGATKLRSCVYGPDDAETTVALTGDSHAAQWAPALRKIAEERGWQLHVYAKSSCSFTLTTMGHDGGAYAECAEWNEALFDELSSEIQPDILFTTSSANNEAASASTQSEGAVDIAAGMNRLWGPLEDAGTDVVAIRDTPRMATRLPECVSLHRDDLSKCEKPAEDAFSNDDPQVLAAENDADADIVDLTDEFCTGDTCLPVIGNVMVYRDSNHITATYSELLAPKLSRALDGVVPAP